jgi:hypothetical protein
MRAQHHRLVRFYYECSNLRYLTGLITIPKLPQDPPLVVEPYKAVVLGIISASEWLESFILSGGCRKRQSAAFNGR